MLKQEILEYGNRHSLALAENPRSGDGAAAGVIDISSSDDDGEGNPQRAANGSRRNQEQVAAVAAKRPWQSGSSDRPSPEPKRQRVVVVEKSSPVMMSPLMDLFTPTTLQGGASGGGGDDDELPPDFLEPLPQVPEEEETEAAPGAVAPSLNETQPQPDRGRTRQFWKAGDYESGRAEQIRSGGSSGMDHVRVHPKFLHSNATSHKWVLGAVAELLDNSLDEVVNGASRVSVDKVASPRDSGPMLVIEDDGGGMSPDAMRRCVSLGYSVKSKVANTIGQYGNGFKTSTMRIGADVIVFSRRPGEPPTQSVGLLSYTFLCETGQEDIIVPMADYEVHPFGLRKIIRGTVDDWNKNVETLCKWSPYASEGELLAQFKGLERRGQGTKVIVFNLWEDDRGQLELDFDADPHDIQVGGVNRDEKNILMARTFPSCLHYFTYKHSLRSYASILYLRLPPRFRIFLRGAVVKHHSLVDDMMYVHRSTYRPHVGEQVAAAGEQPKAVVTLGFVRDAKDHIDVQGFNVYHKNRLIKPFWRIWNAAAVRGRGIVGVLEANFIEPAHDKQDFERTLVLSRLEARLLEMQKSYWAKNCDKIGYMVRVTRKPPPPPPPPPRPLPPVANHRVVSMAAMEAIAGRGAYARSPSARTSLPMSSSAVENLHRPPLQMPAMPDLLRVGGGGRMQLHSPSVTESVAGVYAHLPPLPSAIGSAATRVQMPAASVAAMPTAMVSATALEVPQRREQSHSPSVSDTRLASLKMSSPIPSSATRSLHPPPETPAAAMATAPDLPRRIVQSHTPSVIESVPGVYTHLASARTSLPAPSSSSLPSSPAVVGSLRPPLPMSTPSAAAPVMAPPTLCSAPDSSIRKVQLHSPSNSTVGEALRGRRGGDLPVPPLAPCSSTPTTNPLMAVTESLPSRQRNPSLFLKPSTAVANVSAAPVALIGPKAIKAQPNNDKAASEEKQQEVITQSHFRTVPDRNSPSQQPPHHTAGNHECVLQVVIPLDKTLPQLGHVNLGLAEAERSQNGNASCPLPVCDEVPSDPLQTTEILLSCVQTKPTEVPYSVNPHDNCEPRVVEAQRLDDRLALRSHSSLQQSKVGTVIQRKSLEDLGRSYAKQLVQCGRLPDSGDRVGVLDCSSLAVAGDGCAQGEIEQHSSLNTAKAQNAKLLIQLTDAGKRFCVAMSAAEKLNQELDSFRVQIEQERKQGSAVEQELQSMLRASLLHLRELEAENHLLRMACSSGMG